MHKKQTNIITGTALPLLGYGLYRNSIEQPWFSRPEFVDAIPDSPFKSQITPSRSHVFEVQQRLADAGLMVLSTSEPGSRPGKPVTLMQVTGLAGESFIDELLDRVTKKGATLHQTLLVPQSVEFVLSGMDFRERLIEKVAGISVAQWMNT